MSYQHAQSKDVINRLARIEGHVKAVKQMSEDEKPCEDVLHQIAAIEAALRAVARIVFEDHLEHCVAEANRGEELSELVSGLKSVLLTYLR